MKRSSSMFISKSRRQFSGQSRKSTNAGSRATGLVQQPSQPKGVVQYDISTNTIAATVSKKADAVNNPLLANLTKRNQNAAFSSGTNRWKGGKTDEAAAFLGPGYYEQKGQFDGRAKSSTNYG